MKESNNVFRTGHLLIKLRHLDEPQDFVPPSYIWHSTTQSTYVPTYVPMYLPLPQKAHENSHIIHQEHNSPRMASCIITSHFFALIDPISQQSHHYNLPSLPYLLQYSAPQSPKSPISPKGITNPRGPSQPANWQPSPSHSRWG